MRLSLKHTICIALKATTVTTYLVHKSFPVRKSKPGYILLAVMVVMVKLCFHKVAFSVLSTPYLSQLLIPIM